MENNIAEVVAIRYLDFKNEDGDRVNGYQVFAVADLGTKGWCDGRELLKMWVPVDSDLVTSGYIATLHPGSLVNYVWNRRGKAVLVHASGV